MNLQEVEYILMDLSKGSVQIWDFCLILAEDVLFGIWLRISYSKPEHKVPFIELSDSK